MGDPRATGAMAHGPRSEDAVAPWSGRNSTKAAPALPAFPGASYGPQTDTSPVKALLEAGGQELEDGRCGVRLAGWRIETQKRPILNAREVEIWEGALGTRHLPEMVFGGSWLELVHEETGVCINFNALDALHSWQEEGLPPVPIPAAKQWSRKSNPEAKLFLEYDYTFTTPYCGSLRQYPPGTVRPDDEIGRRTDVASASEARLGTSASGSGSERATTSGGPASSMDIDTEGRIDEASAGTASKGGVQGENDTGQSAGQAKVGGNPSGSGLRWEPYEGGIEMELLTARDPILFYDEVVLYEDELADNGVALLTAKVRVMPRCWFVLLRFWMRVDGALFRLRDARVYCPFQPKNHEKGPCPVTVIREYTQREETVEALAQKGFRSETHNFADPNVLLDKLKVVSSKIERLST